MQGVQIAQNAVDLAQSSYEAAVKKQAETAKAMAEVETRLKSLQEKGKTLVRTASYTYANNHSRQLPGRDQECIERLHCGIGRPRYPDWQDREVLYDVDHDC